MKYDWPAYPAYVLFFLMLFAPAIWQTIKLPFVGIVFLASLLFFLRQSGRNLHPLIATLALLNIAIGLGFVLLGATNGGPGATSVSTVYCLWPLLFTLFISAVSLRRLQVLFRLLIAASLAIALYGSVFIFASAGRLPRFLAVPLGGVQGVTIEAGTVEFSVSSIPTLIFTLPFILALLMTWPPSIPTPFRRWFLWLTFFAGLGVIFLSGRRAALLTIGICPVIITGLWLLQPVAEQTLTRKRIVTAWVATVGIGALILLMLQLVFGLDLQETVASFTSGFQFGANESSYLRREQFFALLREWYESPFVGQGHGTTARGSLRSLTQPWAYELSYIALLFHTGLLGILIYGGSVLSLFLIGIRAIRGANGFHCYFLPVLAGLTCFLIANGTNPYLEKYDFMWVIFLPVALCNLYLRARLKPRPAENV